MPDHDAPAKADHQTLERVAPTAAEPVRRVMSVGAADDHAERDADQRAAEALGWLADQQPLDRQAAEPHVHTAACGIARSHAPQPGPATIGYEGGDLDAGTQSEIESSVGGGESLEAPVRSTMEAAFGADLGKVRIHRGASAGRISRTISAEAFTTGNDIFFADGAYDPSSARGQKVLAHELGHVMQGGGAALRRKNTATAGATPGLTGAAAAKAVKEEAVRKAKEAEQAKKDAAAKKKADDKKKADEAKAAKKAADKKAKDDKAAADKQKKAEEKKAKDEKAAAEKQKKAGIKGERAANTATAQVAQAGAKVQNKENAAVAATMKAAMEAGPVSTLPPDQLVEFWVQVESCLTAEMEARTRVFDKLTDGFTKDVADMAPIEQAAEVEGAKVWDEAPKEVRAYRPLRFDEFDKALTRANQAAQDARVRREAEAEKVRAASTVPMTGKEAHEQVKKQREQDRLAARANAASGDGGKALADKATAAGEKAVAGATGVTPGGEMEARLRAAAEESTRTDASGPVLVDERATVDTIKKVSNPVGKGASKITEFGLEDAGTMTAEGAGSVGDLMDGSTTGVGDVLDMVGKVMTLTATIDSMRKGTADRGAKVTVTKDGVAVLMSAAQVTKTTLATMEKGLKAFDTGSPVLDQVGSALPIVGIITSSLGLIHTALDAIPTFERHFAGVAAVEEALLGKNAPLAAAMDRINSRTAQMIEMSTFKMAKHATMLGLNIAEVASAGGFGIPAAAKLTMSLVDVLHSVGHGIYDTVSESQSSTALKGFNVEHKEGASRDVLKHDIGSGVRQLVLAAQDGLPYARATLLEYGITAAEIGSMDFDELTDQVLKGLEATGDPKTVTEKVNAAVKTVTDTLGVSDAPAGTPADERGILQKISDGIKSVKKGVEDNFDDARQVVASKNAEGHHDKSDRGTGSVLYYAMRGAKDNEKSLDKVRTGMADKAKDKGTTLTEAELPRTSADRKQRAEVAAARAKGPDAGISGPVALENAWVKKITTMTTPELAAYFGEFDASRQNDPVVKAKLTFIEGEVANRIRRAEEEHAKKAKK
ncbi:DUF4157 domain-containing protein [Nocardioides sp. 1609]|uniref:eCIS core domain-containing protein n=1 Tax=Nocardioides sp. 1609 TaxID=2508327 RepID=UPI0010704AA5|nr:DUF4157 domain-containing protein [Nocardioides sp. 1609]